MADRHGITFIDMETCYVDGCPAPTIAHEWYPSVPTVDPRHDGEKHCAISRHVYDPITDKRPLAFRHWWHSVGSGYTGEQSEYVLVPSVAKAQCEYELSKVGIDDDGRTYNRVSRLETFSLMLAELYHHDLIE